MGAILDWRSIPYDSSKRQAVLDLMTLVQGHSTSEAEFVWWFERNPTKYVNIFLAEHAGQVIGVSAASSFRIWCDGAEHLVPFSLNVLTHPDYRGQGIFTRLELANEEDARRQGCPFMLSFPNRLSTPIFVGRLGWSRGKIAPLMMKIATPGRLLKKLSGLGPLERIAAPLVSLARLTFHRRLPENVQPIGDFDETFDRLWEQARRGRRWGFVKDSAYLNWRYVEAPSKRYRLFRIVDGGELAGGLVVGIIEKKRLRLGFIADLFLRDDSACLLRDALVAVESVFADADVDAVLCFAPPDRARWWRYIQGGYLPTPKRFFFIYKIFVERFARLPLGEASRWQFGLGDLDFF